MSARRSTTRGRRQSASAVRQPSESFFDDPAPSIPEAHAPEAMSHRVGPELLSNGAHGDCNLDRRKRYQLIGQLRGYDQPRRFRRLICVNECII